MEKQPEGSLIAEVIAPGLGDIRRIPAPHGKISPQISPGQNKRVSPVGLALYFFLGGDDETRTRDLRRDRPAF